MNKLNKFATLKKLERKVILLPSIFHELGVQSF